MGRGRERDVVPPSLKTNSGANSVGSHRSNRRSASFASKNFPAESDSPSIPLSFLPSFFPSFSQPLLLFLLVPPFLSQSNSLFFFFFFFQPTFQTSPHGSTPKIFPAVYRPCLPLPLARGPDITPHLDNSFLSRKRVRNVIFL